MNSEELNNKSLRLMLSQHLFWDVDKKNIDFIKRKKWVVNRVLQYGLLNDWRIIIKFYGIKELAEIATTLKDIDKRTASLVSTISGIPKEKFQCYITEQSNPQLWNF